MTREIGILRTARALAVGGAVAALSVLFNPAVAQERFDGVTLRVATFGGPWKDAVDSLVGAKLRELGGEVEYVTSEPKDSLSKLILSRGREPGFDVIEVDTSTFNPLMKGQLLESFNTNDVKHSDELNVPIVKDYLIPVYFSQEGVIYNAEKFRELGIAPPERYTDLLDPKLKGHVAFPDINRAASVFALVGLAYDRGGSEENIEPALAAVKEFGATAYSQSTAPDAAAFKAGDIWAFFAHVGWATRLRKAGMEEVSFAHLKVGDKRGVSNIGYMGIAKGSKNIEMAKAFISLFISADVQEKLARKTGIVPVNNTALERLSNDPVLNELMLLSAADVKNMYRLDMQKIDIPKWTDMWNRYVVQ